MTPGERRSCQNDVASIAIKTQLKLGSELTADFVSRGANTKGKNNARYFFVRM
jgi:hypothetical protein